MFKWVSESEQATKDIANYLGTCLGKGDVITLIGQLGVGKTTFTKGLAKGLGIDDVISSPTFTIVKEYEGRLPLFHMDAYRLEFSDEDIGFDDYFYGDGVSVIEWANFIEEFLPQTYLSIQIERLDDTNRKITFNAIGEHYAQLIENIRRHVS